MELIKKDNISYSDHALKNFILSAIDKYKVEVTNEDVVTFKDNKLEIFLDIIIREKMATVSGTVNIIKNEITDSLNFFSTINPETIQIQIRKEGNK